MAVATSPKPARLVQSGTRLAVGEHEFNCGEPIEIRIASTWLKGWVEYSHNAKPGYTGWYFTGNDGFEWCPLVAGMVVGIEG